MYMLRGVMWKFLVESSDSTPVRAANLPNVAFVPSPIGARYST